MPYEKERASVAAFMVRLYDRGLTTAGGGNISLRLPDGMFAITPSALDKGNLTPEEIALVTMEGENRTPEKKISIETEMHRLLLAARPDMNAVVHAHPAYATLFSAFGGGIDTRLTAEAWCLLGDVPVVPYARMGSDALAKAVAHYGETHDVLLMENHGVVTLGKTLLEAFEKIDVLERAARMTVAASTLERSGMVRHDLDEARRAVLTDYWKNGRK